MSAERSSSSRSSSLNDCNSRQRCRLLQQQSADAVCVSFQVLKGGHEAPTKPKGRPKKNSIPTTEEIEAEERRLKAEEEERLQREAERAADRASGGRVSPPEHPDLRSETLTAASAAMEASEAASPPLMRPQPEAGALS